jgi:hypothetical protein
LRTIEESVRADNVVPAPRINAPDLSAEIASMPLMADTEIRCAFLTRPSFMRTKSSVPPAVRTASLRETLAAGTLEEGRVVLKWRKLHQSVSWSGLTGSLALKPTAFATALAMAQDTGDIALATSFDEAPSLSYCRNDVNIAALDHLSARHL